jgi:tetratricopeptide (TPR) repeat protein
MPRLSYVLTLVVALWAVPARADNKEKALALFEKSDKAYKDGKFEQAAKLLEEAYGLYPEPTLLYNLGRAQEGLGDVPGAIASYERYLQDAKQIGDRGAIERRVATLKAQLAARDDEQKRLAEEEAKRKQAEEERKQAEEEHKRAEEERLRLEAQRQHDKRSPLEKFGPWITMGAGGAVIATGIYFGVRASSTHDDAVATPVQRDALLLQDSAEKSAKIANILFVIGGLTTAGGLGWKIWQLSTEDAEATVTVGPTGVAVGGTW